MSNNVTRQALGGVTAYNHAVAGGYTGTYAEFCALMASYATVAQQAAASAQQAETAASSFGKTGLSVTSGELYMTDSGDVKKKLAKDETFVSLMQKTIELAQAKNHLLLHQNAAIDLLAKDKRAELVTDISAVAGLAKSGELTSVMSYGDQIKTTWTYGANTYTPALNLCHESDELLEDGETIHGCYFEWDKTTPVGMPFDPPEAIFESSSALAAGTYYFTVKNDSWGGNNDKHIQFTLTENLPAGYQIRKSVGYNGNVLNGTLDVYASGSSLTKLYSLTPTEGTNGTNLGNTDGSGDLNHWHRVALGHNRWKYSNLRQWLNATGAKNTWWTKQEKWDVKPSEAESVDGFLYGYTSSTYEYFMPIKVVTVACDIDGNVEDVTYDRVFLASLEQTYITPQFSGKEGSYFEYYKRLLGRTTPAAQGQTYPRLIKYGLDNASSAQYCFRRSAYRNSASDVWRVYASGGVYHYGANYAYRCAPCVFVSN